MSRLNFDIGECELNQERRTPTLRESVSFARTKGGTVISSVLMVLAPLGTFVVVLKG